VALRFVFLAQQQQLNCVDVFVHALRLPLPERLSTVLNFTSSLLMLFFVQHLFRNSVVNCRALKPLHSQRLQYFVFFTERRQFGAFPRYSVKIHVIFGVRLKVGKKQTYMKTETCKLYSSLLNAFAKYHQNRSKIDPYNFELYRFKVWSFFETQCSLQYV